MDKSKYLKPREYEMLAILVPDQGEEESKAAIDTVQGYITSGNGTIDSINTDSPWGRRRLAYTIRHEGVDYRDGHYVLAYFTMLPSALAELERDLKLDTNVIRYLILINDPEMGEKIDPSAVEAEQAEEGTEEAPATEATAEEAPAEEETAPVEEVATEEAAPAEEVAAEEEAPAEEATTEETPAEETAEEEAPAEETEAEASEESDKE